MWTGVDALAVIVPVDSGIGLLTIIGHSVAWWSVNVSVIVVTASVAALIVVAACVGSANVRES
jgi:hypothetical protein